MSLEGRSIIGALLKGARLRCPVCGGASVFQSPFRVRPECPSCGSVFQREEGFFVGAIMINVVTTEAAVMATAGLWLLASSAGESGALFAALFAVALLFPVAFYHHAWSLWLAADHLVEGLPGRRPGA